MPGTTFASSFVSRSFHFPAWTLYALILQRRFQLRLPPWPCVTGHVKPSTYSHLQTASFFCHFHCRALVKEMCMPLHIYIYKESKSLYRNKKFALINHVLIKQPILLHKAPSIHFFSTSYTEKVEFPPPSGHGCLASLQRAVWLANFFSIFVWWSRCWRSLSMKPSPHFHRTVLRYSGTLPLPPPPPPAPVALCLTTPCAPPPASHPPPQRSYNSKDVNEANTTPTHPPALFIRLL